MNIFAIMGSPRRGGNTEVMLDTFLAEAGEGFQLTLVIPSELRIHSCRGCRVCERTGECVIDDDMERVAGDILGADRIVVATPVFFYGLPASLKTLVDRTQFLWSRKYFLKQDYPPKKGFLLSVGATGGKKLFAGVILTTRYFFDSFNCAYTGELVFRGFDRKGEIAGCASCLLDIRQAAKTFFAG
ncbi:MAG TPA: flavodoxin family protein [Atribacteraceae bacterium]|nr:flavodoxin family protein [Atribacteraceae bacterium]